MSARADRTIEDMVADLQGALDTDETNWAALVRRVSDLHDDRCDLDDLRGSVQSLVETAKSAAESAKSAAESAISELELVARQLEEIEALT